jgi:hypothetical protein
MSAKLAAHAQEDSDSFVHDPKRHPLPNVKPSTVLMCFKLRLLSVAKHLAFSGS